MPNAENQRMAALPPHALYTTYINVVWCVYVVVDTTTIGGGTKAPAPWMDVVNHHQRPLPPKRSERMKKKYDPIRVPVCRCGRQSLVSNRITASYPAWVFRFQTVDNDERNAMSPGERLKLLTMCHVPMWLCGCPDCEIYAPGHTKRAAIAAFEKQVEVCVYGE